MRKLRRDRTRTGRDDNLLCGEFAPGDDDGFGSNKTTFAARQGDSGFIDAALIAPVHAADEFIHAREDLPEIRTAKFCVDEMPVRVAHMSSSFGKTDE
jgi:hypothetical protein